MTTELEEQFFKMFGIKPIFRYLVQSELPIIGTDHCRPVYDLTKKQFKNFALSRAKGYRLVEVIKIYPEITDRKLLEMICIANKANIEVIGETVEEMKNKLLEEMVYWKDGIVYKEIQQLFKEEE